MGGPCDFRVRAVQWSRGVMRWSCSVLGHSVASMPQAKLSTPVTLSLLQCGHRREQVELNCLIIVCRYYTQNCRIFVHCIQEQKSLDPTTGKPPCFKGCPLRRIIKRTWWAQGGDFSNQNGTGGESICGRKTWRWKFHYKHNEEGLLSMAKASMACTNSLQFITTVLTPLLGWETHSIWQGIKEWVWQRFWKMWRWRWKTCPIVCYCRMQRDERRLWSGNIPKGWIWWQSPRFPQGCGRGFKKIDKIVFQHQT